MPNEQELREAVASAVAEASVPATETPAENVSSQEVKTEVPAEVKTEAPVANAVDTAKLQEQVNNLNIALRQERESSKGSAETIKALQEQLKSSSETLEKMKKVFSPEPEQTQTQEQTPQFLTAEQLEAFLAKKEEEKLAEASKKDYAAKIASEVKSLETEWDGTDGKPMYDDNKVIEWQDANNKLHLTPSEAFYEMNRNAIIDWEIKKRLDNKPNVQNVERPGASPAGREPATPGKPKTESELREQVFAAIEAAMVDTNN
jgi:hypothetical protein